MKKQLLTILSLTFGMVAFGQVGVNTSTPTATLDITAKTTVGDSVEGLLIPRVDRLKAQTMASIPTSTLIYVNSVANGGQTGNALNIDDVGYYYFNGSLWTKLTTSSTPSSSVNIYNTDGTLAGNRIVTQGANFLRFTPTIAHGFSVNGNTFSVDGENSRVGIGTITPQRKLHINGPMQLTNEFNVGGTNTTAGSAGANGQILTSGGAATAPSWENPVNLYVANGTLTGNRVVTQGSNFLRFTPTIPHGFSVDGNTFSVDGANNKVGIGTIAPETKLHVVSTVENSARFNLMDSPVGTDQYFILALRNTSAMAVGNYSLLGFTNSGPTNGGANWAVGSIRSGVGVVTGAQEDFYIGSSIGGGLVEKLRIKPASGNVGIGVSNPLYKLDVDGVINASGNVRANGVVLTSDSRLKKDIHDTSYGLKTVMALRPVEYQKKNSIQNNDYNKHEIGFLAQDIAKVIPSLVTSGADKDKLLSVSYTELIPVLAKAIQEQQKEISQLKEENKKLADVVENTKTMEKEYTNLAQQIKDMQRILGVKKTESSVKVAVK
ncbi:tail fiber domain-containing protein [Chryseobacterium sp. MMS23-Vi53]|uniref:tail fiber domain-containing protein n=1 Tax=Chryseobacterium sp. MMS23-Vi53 TaxID=3386644 RepID=UPI0039E97C36